MTSFDARPIIDSMRKMSFSSRDTARAADIFNMALRKKKVEHMLDLADPRRLHQRRAAACTSTATW
jgi:deoxyhypusine synthase